jgi:hypothetical protein
VQANRATHKHGSRIQEIGCRKGASTSQAGGPLINRKSNPVIPEAVPRSSLFRDERVVVRQAQVPIFRPEPFSLRDQDLHRFELFFPI